MSRRGEQAANSLEAELDKFEDKLNAILESLGVDPNSPDEFHENNVKAADGQNNKL